MEYIQIGSSNFINNLFNKYFKVAKLMPFREFIASENLFLEMDGVILVPPKNDIININRKNFSFDVNDLIIISSIAVSVKSFVSPKFQNYKKYKCSIENIVCNTGNIRFLRLAMFVSLNDLRSILIFLLACLLSYFAPKNRVYMYTTKSCLKDIDFSKNEISCFKSITGKGYFFIKNRRLNLLILKLFVKP